VHEGTLTILNPVLSNKTRICRCWFLVAQPDCSTFASTNMGGSHLHILHSSVAQWKTLVSKPQFWELLSSPPATRSTTISTSRIELCLLMQVLIPRAPSRVQHLRLHRYKREPPAQLAVLSSPVGDTGVYTTVFGAAFVTFRPPAAPQSLQALLSFACSCRCWFLVPRPQCSTFLPP
jgi:hypothetical protein